MEIWYVDFPLDQYVEDVKKIARLNNLKIIDSIYQLGDSQCENKPTLTYKSIEEVKRIVNEHINIEEEVVVTPKPKRNTNAKKTR